MDRRSFLQSLLASVATHQLVVRQEQTETRDTTSVSRKGDDKPVIKMCFGKHVLVAGRDFNIESPVHKCPHTKRITHCGPAYAKCELVVGTQEAFDAICSQYGDVTKAKAKPPVLIQIAAYGNDLHMATLDHVVLQQIAWSASADGKVVVQNLQFVGIWREQKEEVQRIMDEYPPLEFHNGEHPQDADLIDWHDYGSDREDFNAPEHIASLTDKQPTTQGK